MALPLLAERVRGGGAPGPAGTNPMGTGANGALCSVPAGAITSGGIGEPRSRCAGRGRQGVHRSNKLPPPKGRQVHLWEELGTEEMLSGHELWSAGDSGGLDSGSELWCSSGTTEEGSGASFSMDVSDGRQRRGRSDSESGASEFSTDVRDTRRVRARVHR